MKKTKILAVILAAVMLLALCAGCGNKTEAQPTQAPAAEPTAEPAQTEPSAQPTEEPAEEKGISFTDMAGREISLDAPAEKIVALAAADCEILYAIGAGEKLVGRGEYCDYPAEVMDVEAVQSGAETNIEQIIALQPQAVVMSVMAQTKEQVEQLENAGIKVIVSDAQDIEGVYTAIEMLGKLTGKDDEAAEVISGMKTAFEAIEAQPVSDGTQTVYFEVSPLQWGLWTAGTGTFMDEIANMMGLRNCFDDVSGWAEISEEQVLERNPDYIVTISMYYGEGPTPTEEILARAGWENVSAVKSSAILNLQDNELSRPGPRLADGAQMLYDFVTGIQDAGSKAA